HPVRKLRKLYICNRQQNPIKIQSIKVPPSSCTEAIEVRSKGIAGEGKKKKELDKKELKNGRMMERNP
ncbi:hypothetical protein Csa_004574, partial [Cucumis sativus]